MVENKKNGCITFGQYLKKAMKDKELREEYDKLELEYKAIKAKLKEDNNMHCEHRENYFEPETEGIMVDANGVIRAILMSVGDVLIDLCNDMEINELKINVSYDFDNGSTTLKAKVDGEKVLKITASNIDDECY